MKTTKSYTNFNIGKYLPYIGNKKMFAAISFTHSMVEQKKPISTAICIAARYYEVDQDLLAVWYSMLVENIKLEKANAKSDAPQSWESKMDQLESIMIN